MRIECEAMGGTSVCSSGVWKSGQADACPSPSCCGERGRTVFLVLGSFLAVVCLGRGAETDARFHGGAAANAALPRAAEWASAVRRTDAAVFRKDEPGDIAPVAVWSPTPTSPAGSEALAHLIDGDWSTACCFLDDTPTGTNPNTQPPLGSSPVTARVVLDLGRVVKIAGIRFVAAKSWANVMAENVSVFACDDCQGEKNIRVLRENEPLPPANTFNAVFVTWTPVETRYLSVRINESYDRPRSGLDWWRAIDPDKAQKERRCVDALRCQFGWWWGAWLGTVAKLPAIAGGGPSYEIAGTGGRFSVRIAEVSCFCGEPADLPRPNPPGTAYPQDRLTRDWLYQDCGVENVSLVANSTDGTRPDPIGPDIAHCFASTSDSLTEQRMVQKVLADLADTGIDVLAFQTRLRALVPIPGNDVRWKTLYLDTCRARRAERLKALRKSASQFIYVKHYVFGGWTQTEPTDEVTDEQFFERNPDFREGSQLCLATIREDGNVTNEVLIEKPHGVIRDPNLSFDAKTLVFSMRDNFDTDDNHLYVMNLADRKIRQITFSATAGGRTWPCSDTEPCFLPSGDILFQSTRCGQLDVCWAHPASNLYVCDAAGKYVRRLAFDQVRTLYPQVLADGRVIYTRWEYNDRNPFFLQSLFVMNADGTGQTAFYGNNSTYPAALIHSRGIPNSGKVITVISGHHVVQKGKLAILDPSKGTDGNDGIEYVSGASPDGKPGRQPSNIRAPFDRWPFDLFGQVGPQWQYPFAFDEHRYLVSFLPEGSHFMKGPFTAPFGVYFMTDTGDRELLAFDWGNSCGQAIPLMPTARPPVRPSQVDWRRSTGTFYVQDVYEGPGLQGVKRGTVTRLRVVALEYRAAGVSKNYNRGPAGDSHINTPIATRDGAQDVKHVLGEVPVEEDGSAYFEVPARTAVYFQLLDAKGCCVQTMRSWTLVLPGERFGCVGCHENKLQAVLSAERKPRALGKAAQCLQPLAGQPPHPLVTRLEKESPLEATDLFLGVNKPCSLDPDAPADGFSYRRLIQPIWDRHCVSCHQGNVKDPDKTKRSPLALTGQVPQQLPGGLRAFTTSYLALTEKGPCSSWANWVDPESMAPVLPPYACGSAQSKLMADLEPSHYNVQLTDAEKRLVACWMDLGVPFCGSYGEANTWDRQERNCEWNTWNLPQKELYDSFQRKREVYAREELNDVKAFLHR